MEIRKAFQTVFNAAGMPSRKDVADAMGWTPQRLDHYLQGRRTLNAAEADSMAAALKMTMDTLLEKLRDQGVDYEVAEHRAPGRRPAVERQETGAGKSLRFKRDDALRILIASCVAAGIDRKTADTAIADGLAVLELLQRFPDADFSDGRTGQRLRLLAEQFDGQR